MSVRETGGGGKLVLDLEQHKFKIYLKYLTEGCLAMDSNGEGALRRVIWDYLQKKYKDAIDYRDFLLAIRRFLIDGKMNNDEGKYTMHPEVVEEMRKNTPTPTSKLKGPKDNIFLNLAKTKKVQRQGGSKDSARSLQDQHHHDTHSHHTHSLRGASAHQDEDEKGESAVEESHASRKSLASKVSNSGKRQKVKPHKESTRQSKIEKYYARKQAQRMNDISELEFTKSQNKKLGFATPAPDNTNIKQDQEEEEQEKIVMLRDESEDEGQDNLLVSESKLGFNTQPVHNKRGRKPKQTHEPLSQRVSKKSKAITKTQQVVQKQVVHSQKQIQISRAGRRASQLSQGSINLIDDERSTGESENLRLHQHNLRHPIHFLTQPATITNNQTSETNVKEKIKGRGRKPKAVKDVVQVRSKKAKLPKIIIKALKEAVKSKNLRIRGRHLHKKEISNESEGEQKLSQKTVIQKKTKGIAKVKKIIRIPKLNLPSRMKLRGKTLDLTKMGLIKKARVRLDAPASPKADKSQKILKAVGFTPQKQRKSLAELDYEEYSAPLQRSDKKQSSNRQHSQEKAPAAQIHVHQTRSVKKKAKTRQSSKVAATTRQAKAAHKIQNSTLLQKVQLSNIVYSDRKAKIDAAKNLRQLYSMHSHREGLLIDEMFIYL